MSLSSRLVTYAPHRGDNWTVAFALHTSVRSKLIDNTIAYKKIIAQTCLYSFTASS